MTTYTFPHINIDVKKEDTSNTVAVTDKPLHMPVVFLFAEKGPEAYPTVGDSTTITNLFGSNTFNNASNYYNHQSMVAQMALGYGKIGVIRMVPNDAAYASLLLECTLTKTSMPQYQRAGDGSLLLGADGNPQPKVDGSGKAIVEDGYVASWTTRALTADEEYDSVSSTTTGAADAITSYTFPVLGFYAKYRTSSTNRMGVRLWYTSSVDTTAMSRIDSWLYRFQPVQLATSTSTNVSVISDIFTQNYNDVSLMASSNASVDPNTADDMSLAGVLSNNFNSLGNNSLDFDTFVYSDNVKQIGTLIKTLAPTEFSTVDPFMINIIGGVDESGHTYNHFQVDDASGELLNSTNVMYLTGGADGDLSLSNFESLVIDYVTGEDNTPFLDQFRYGFTHFYDSGFSLTNKYSLLNMLDLRDGLYMQMTTFSASSTTPNTQAQDQSSGAALLAQARSHVESTTYGTSMFRVSIDAQAGKLAESTGYTSGWVSPVFHVLTLNSTYYSGTRVTGSPKGRPNNVVTVFSDVSWTDATIAQKQLNWDTGLNVMTYADEDVIFYADRRTVFPDDTSILSSETFGHYTVFTKKIVRNIWTFYVGREEAVSVLKDNISNDVDTAIFKAFGTYMSSSTTVTQTALDIKNGFSYTVTVALTGNMPNRVWNVIIPVSKSTDTSTTTSTS